MSVGPDDIHLTVLREYADVAAKPLSMFEKLCNQVKTQVSGKREMYQCLKKGGQENPRSYQPIRLPSIPEKNMEQILLEPGSDPRTGR